MVFIKCHYSMEKNISQKNCKHCLMSGQFYFWVKICKDLLLTLDNNFKQECTAAVHNRSQTARLKDPGSNLGGSSEKIEKIQFRLFKHAVKEHLAYRYESGSNLFYWWRYRLQILSIGSCKHNVHWGIILKVFYLE